MNHWQYLDSDLETAKKKEMDGELLFDLWFVLNLDSLCALDASQMGRRDYELCLVYSKL